MTLVHTCHSLPPPPSPPTLPALARIFGFVSFDSFCTLHLFIFLRQRVMSRASTHPDSLENPIALLHTLNPKPQTHQQSGSNGTSGEMACNKGANTRCGGFFWRRHWPLSTHGRTFLRRRGSSASLRFSPPPSRGTCRLRVWDLGFRG